MNTYALRCTIMLICALSPLAAMQLAQPDTHARAELFISKIIKTHNTNLHYTWNPIINAARKNSYSLYDYFQIDNPTTIISSIPIPEEKQSVYIDQILKGIWLFRCNNRATLIVTGAEETIKQALYETELNKPVSLSTDNSDNSLLFFGSCIAVCTLIATLATQHLMARLPKIW